MNFDRGPIDLYVDGERTVRYGRAFFDGTTLTVWQEWLSRGITQPPSIAHQTVNPEFVSTGMTVTWATPEHFYKIQKASGCGCNYRGLAIAKASDQEALNV